MTPGQLIATKIKAFREQEGLNQHEMAERADLSYPAIQKLETGRGNPELDTLFKLAEIGVPVGDIFPRKRSAKEQALDHVSSESIQDLRDMLRKVSTALDAPPEYPLPIEVAEGIRKRVAAKIVNFLATNDVDWRARAPLLSEKLSSADGTFTLETKSKARKTGRQR